MDEAFEIRLASSHRGRAIMRERHDVGSLNQFGRTASAEQELSGIVRMAYADMAKGIAHFFCCQDAIGHHKLVDGVFQVGAHRIKLTAPRDPNSWASIPTRRSLIFKSAPTRFST